MFVAGIDAHATYSVIAVASNTGELVETSPAWQWLFDRLEGPGVHFVLAHAKRLRMIAESNCKSDDIDAELLARMRLAGLIPEVHTKSVEQREQAVLLRSRARLVRQRTQMAKSIHS